MCGCIASSLDWVVRYENIIPKFHHSLEQSVFRGQYTQQGKRLLT